MSRRRTTTALCTLVPLAVVLTACGGGGGKGAHASGTHDPASVAASAAATDDGAAARQSNTFQNAIATCMKAQGFSYIPQAPVTKPSESALDKGDYAALKAFRQKYGFGAFSPYVYPGDPNVAPAQTAPPHDANDDIVNGLAGSQKAAYYTVLYGFADPAQMKAANHGSPAPDSCQGRARTQVYGPAPSQADLQAQEERDRQARDAVLGDPVIVNLASTYASCLRSKGYQIDSDQPTGLADALQIQWFTKAYGMLHDGTVDAATARPLLQQEIAAALDDLDCGKDFRAAYLPRIAAAGGEGLG